MISWEDKTTCPIVNMKILPTASGSFFSLLKAIAKYKGKLIARSDNQRQISIAIFGRALALDRVKKRRKELMPKVKQRRL